MSSTEVSSALFNHRVPEKMQIHCDITDSNIFCRTSLSQEKLHYQWKKLLQPRYVSHDQFSAQLATCMCHDESYQSS